MYLTKNFALRLSLLILAFCSSGSLLDSCIPAIGITAISDPNEYLPRILASIDFCVDTVIIYHSKGISVSDYSIILKNNTNVRNVRITRDLYGRYLFGVSEGWNSILHMSEKHLWIVMVAFDVIFLPNQLSQLNRRYWKAYMEHSGNIFAFVKYVNFETKLAAYNTFVLSRYVIDKVGYFDENFFPAFYEDNDWSVRMRLAGVHVMTFDDVSLWHGDLPNNRTNAFSYMSGTRLFMNSLPYWERTMREGIRSNRFYFQSKWNCSYVGKTISINTSDCHNTSPFGNSSTNVSYWVKNDHRINGLRSCVEMPLIESAKTFKSGRLPANKRGMHFNNLRVRHFMGFQNPNCTIKAGSAVHGRLRRRSRYNQRNNQSSINSPNSTTSYYNNYDNHNTTRKVNFISNNF